MAREVQHLVNVSGGKDSTATYLLALESGRPAPPLPFLQRTGEGLHRPAPLAGPTAYRRLHRMHPLWKLRPDD